MAKPNNQKRDGVKKVTSIGKSGRNAYTGRTRYKSKHDRRNKKHYRGQGK